MATIQEVFPQTAMLLLKDPRTAYPLQRHPANGPVAGLYLSAPIFDLPDCCFFQV